MLASRPAALRPMGRRQTHKADKASIAFRTSLRPEPDLPAPSAPGAAWPVPATSTALRPARAANRALHSPRRTASRATVKSQPQASTFRSSTPLDCLQYHRPPKPNPTSEKSHTTVPVAPLAWLRYPLCPSPPGPRGSPRPTWPPPPKGGGISGVARDVATCAAEAACVSVLGGSFGREEGGARQAVTSPLSHSHHPLP